jgi:hypothetical protein
MTVEHRLGFALRVDDHFTVTPVGEELQVALDTGEPVVRAPSGSARHDDGTYRWADLPDGARKLTIRSRGGRWLRWDSAPIDVFLPLTNPQQPVVVEMWPAPIAAPPPGVPAIRGKLLGANVAGLRVEIDGTGTTAPSPTLRWTRANEHGELLFPLPGGPWPRTAAGALALTVAVPGRTVTTVDVIPDLASFGGSQFELAADRVSRVHFHVT